MAAKCGAWARWPAHPQLGAPRWSHDGTRLAFATVDASAGARRWFVVGADGGGLRPFGLGSYPDWSPEDKQLVFGIGEKVPVAAGIWVQNDDGRGRLLLSEGGLAPRWSPGGDKLAFLDDEALTILDLVDSGRQKLDLPGGVMAGFDWSPDGKQLAFVTRGDKANELWIADVADTAQRRKALSGDVDGYLAWSPRGKRLAISQADQLHLLDADGSGEPQLIPGQEGNNRMPAWSADGQWIAFASTRATPALVPVVQAKRKVRLEEVKRHVRGDAVYGLALSPDGRRAVLGGRRNVEVWNLDDDSTSMFERQGEFVSLSPDGKTVALCGGLVKVTLLDVDSGKPLRELHTASMCVDTEFSPDSKRVACATIRGPAQVWDVGSGNQVSTFDNHQAPVTRMAFLSGGAEVVSNGQDKYTRIWNAETGQERIAIAHPEVVWGLAVSPSGRLIATGTGGATDGNPLLHRIKMGQEHVIRLWDAASGKLVREINGHTGPVFALAFSPDGQTLVSGGWDGTIRMWDVATGSELAMAKGEGPVFSLGLTPDGGQLVVGGGQDRNAGRPIRSYRDEQVRVYRIVEDGKAQPAGD